MLHSMLIYRQSRGNVKHPFTLLQSFLPTNSHATRKLIAPLLHTTTILSPQTPATVDPSCSRTPKPRARIPRYQSPNIEAVEQASRRNSTISRPVVGLKDTNICQPARHVAVYCPHDANRAARGFNALSNNGDR